ncbi:hypothetical protein ACIQZO_25410 [Streptomyces sp. NPDC097617]|uniref:hypothetical protein n=1 Tax=Streptomyces sp. NPDC097617 TaxID=3366091 RepID=UPI00381F1AA1
MDRNAGQQQPPTTAELFDHCLTDEGLARLWSLLDSGCYELRAPEEAALLCVAWLVRAGKSRAAAELVAELRPLAAEGVRFAPYSTDRPVPDADAVHVRTVGEVSQALARRAPRPRVETQHEALTVWRPFEDELLDHWLRAGADPGSADPARGAALLARYRHLAATHTRCTGHLDPKSNPAVLLRALTETVAGGGSSPRLAGQLRHAVTSMVAGPGRPGSAEHTRLLRYLARQADRPAHHDLADLVRLRLAPYDVSRGLTDVEALLVPVTDEEAAESGLPAGTAVPASVRAAVTEARSAPLATLLEQGAIPSAEVLGEVAARLVDTHAARGHTDEALRRLIAATCRTRRHHRREVAELPWVRALAPWASDPAEEVRSTLRMLGEACVRTFPGTGLPNRLALEMSWLARSAGSAVRFALEPSADTYSGMVFPEVLVAARSAAELLRGTVYEHYYGIDFAAVRDLADAGNRYGFARLCAERAGRPGASPATDPSVIEQVRTLTTSNLATLVTQVGVDPQGGWGGPARGAFAAATGRGATPRTTAGAWRQLLFHLALCDADEQGSVLAWIDARAARLPVRTAARIALLLADLRLAAAAVPAAS